MNKDIRKYIPEHFAAKKKQKFKLTLPSTDD